MAVTYLKKLNAEEILAGLATNPAVVSASVKLDKKQGIMKTVATMGDGQVRVQKLVGKSFKEMTVFDPTGVSPDERRDLVVRLRGANMTQAEIADHLGVSQATVSLDLKKAQKTLK
ncbi:sigma factor-like helix-turn-helix DNA-binding protein [Burkholderia gladioli]|uniref:sigma factor-like helix-turn-helix DNA-binding protein n=1 Tax=Burkholderia gladioli TaxID=28095 RepID=UPI00163E7974|nr:sigma factor-like helix-turn-helix DNA-binding protein [Burkholderia gladioli]MDA0573923.1 ArsR family transcriptional regulator [Burkholderia gladioli]MDA0603292.1 ArsR family transcriptional regulator [Burkholderia gladioli]